MTATVSQVSDSVHVRRRTETATQLPAPTLLQPDEELVDLRVSAVRPVLFFAVPLPAPRLVTVRLQESNTAGRCQLLLSPVHTHPNVHNAVWRLLSPGPLKTLSVHPADPNYRTGLLYLCVQYLEDSGHCLLRLRVTLQECFTAPWFQRVRCAAPGPPHCASASTRSEAVRSAKSDANGVVAGDEAEVDEVPMTETGPLQVVESDIVRDTCEAGTCCSFYTGEWCAATRHGRGMAFYSTLENAFAASMNSGEDTTTPSFTLTRTVYERSTVPWSAESVPEFVRVCVRRGAAAPDAELGPVPDLRAARGWCVVAGLPTGVEAYDGEWAHNAKHGFGIYQWADRSYVGDWVHDARDGTGVLERCDGSWYRGAWKADRRHGYGEARLMPSQAVYKGQWVCGRREGEGVLEYANGVVVRGVWRCDELQQSRVCASYPDGSVYEGEWSHDGRHGRGTLTDPQQCVYTNTWHHDQRQGEGEVVLTNAVRFRGTWSEGAVVEGCYHFPNGDVYTGEWNATRNEREGCGRCVSKNGDVYEGMWHEDRRHGHGTMYAADGRWRYEGEWSNGQRCGHGVLTDADGVYKGHFESDVRSGEGVQFGADGSHYSGSWRNDHRAGRGVYYCAREDTLYEGIFLYDRLQGRGSAVVHTPSDERYDGTWLDGLRQGGGTVVLANGDVLHGIWHRGVHQDGRVEYHYAQGDKYVGDWFDGERHGQGTLVREDGSVYDGAWAHDTPHGHGRLTRPNGETVEGEWCAGELLDGCGVLEMTDASVYRGEMRRAIPHGEGELTYPDGTTFRGHFENGVYVL